MKRLYVAGLAAAAFFSGAVDAADLRPGPIYQPVVAPITYFTFTGCFIGANVGGLWDSTDWIDRIPADPAFGADFGRRTAAGAIGGVQGTCNYQIHNWVVGVQGGYDWTSASGANSNLLAPALSDQTQTKTLASIAPRVGYAWDRLLAYVKGGGASVRRIYSVSFAGATIGIASETRGGWTVGAGLEYAFLDWLTGFAEYDYYKFGSGGNTFACTGCGLFAPAVPFNVTTSINVFKVGLNFTMPDEWDPQRSRSTPRR